MKISIAMTTYNSSMFINKQLNSLLNQSLPFDELVIVDDCSKDNTLDILKKFCDDNYNRNIKIFRNAINSGYVKSFEKAIYECTGDIIFLCDHDDIWNLKKIEEVYKVFAKYKNVKCVGTSFNKIDEKGDYILEKERINVSNHGYIKRKIKKKISPMKLSEIIYCNFTPGCCLAISNEIIYGLRGKFNIAPHDYLISVYAALKNELYFLDERLVDYRIHKDNTLGQKKGSNYIERLEVSKRDYLDKKDIYESLICYMSIKQQKKCLKIIKKYKKRYTFLKNKKIFCMLILSITNFFINTNFSFTLLKDLKMIIFGDN